MLIILTAGEYDTYRIEDVLEFNDAFDVDKVFEVFLNNEGRSMDIFDKITEFPKWLVEKHYAKKATGFESNIEHCFEPIKPEPPAWKLYEL